MLDPKPDPVLEAAALVLGLVRLELKREAFYGARAVRPRTVTADFDRVLCHFFVDDRPYCVECRVGDWRTAEAAAELVRHVLPDVLRPAGYSL